MTHRSGGNSGADWTKLRSNAKAGDYSMKEKIFNSFVPPSILAAEGLGGGSGFSSVAHRQQQLNRMNNLINNGVDDEILFCVMDKNKDAIKTPFMYEGQLRYPDDEGIIRLTNKAPVELALQIKKYEEEKTDDLMEIFLGGDDIAAYVVGMSESDWMNICKGKQGGRTGSGGCPAGCKMSDEMKDEDCSIINIESLVAGSITQTRALSKLRKIAKHYLKNVNLESFDTMKEKKADMATGQNANKEAPPLQGAPQGGAPQGA